LGGSFETRDINTVDDDPQSIVSISSNQITLAAGTYRCLISCPAVESLRHKARLQNITAASTLLEGTSEFSGTLTGFHVTRSLIVGRFTVAAGQMLEIQHQVGAANTDGFGKASGFGASEVYTIAEFWREE